MTSALKEPRFIIKWSIIAWFMCSAPTTNYTLKHCINSQNLLHSPQLSIVYYEYSQCPFSIYAWARSAPMREDIIYLISCLIGWDLVQPQEENQSCSLTQCNLWYCIQHSKEKVDSRSNIEHTKDTPCLALPGKLSWPCLNIKTVFPRYGYSHVKDKKVTRPSYL